MNHSEKNMISADKINSCKTSRHLKDELLRRHLKDDLPTVNEIIE